MQQNIGQTQISTYIFQSPPTPISNLALTEEGDVVPLDDDLVIDLYNLSYDEFQKKIVQAWRNNFPNDHASPAFFRERVIVADTRNNPNAIIEANLAL